MDPVKELIVQKIRESGLTMAAISRKMNRNAAYLQQFIKRNVPKELEEEDRDVLASILGVDSKLLKGPGRQRKTIEETDFGPMIRFMKAYRDRAAHGSEGSFPYFEGVPLEQGSLKIASYPRFRSALSDLFSPNTYLLLITDDNLPELRRGAVAFVDPDITPRADMICVLRKIPIEGESEAFVRQIFEINEDTFRVYGKESIRETSNNQRKSSAKSLRNSLEDFSRKEWRAEIIVGSLFPSVK